MGTTHNKVQMNVYVPEHLNNYVNELHAETGLSKSDIIALLLTYTKQFWTPQTFKDLTMTVRALGASGLQKVS